MIDDTMADTLKTKIKLKVKVTHLSTGRIGRVVEIQGKSARVEWDDGGTASWVKFENLERRVGRPTGEGKRIPKAQKHLVRLERRFKDVISEEMQRQNLTWETLSERTGVNRSTIARILRTNGERQWLDTIERIAEGLGISPARFWTVTSETLDAAA